MNVVITDKKLALESESYMTVTGQAGVSVVGNTITRTAAGSSWGAAGGSSVQTVEQGQYIEWTMGSGSATNNRYIMAGISYSNPDHTNLTQQYCWYTYLTGFTIVESGLVASGTTLGGFGALNTTAVLKIARENGMINYYKDNVLQRSVTDPQPETAMIVDFSLFENARSIYSLKIGTINYDAVAVMKADYYPFGMTMPGRDTSVTTYRYAYNGMEQDNELKGQGNSYTTEFRQYDPRIGRWLSLDPLMHMFPWMSPYVGFNNNPIFFVDPYGLKGEPAGNSKLDGAVQKYHVDQKFNHTEFERKLPSSGVDVGTTFEFDFSPSSGKTYSNGDRMRMSYTYAGNGTWNKTEQLKGMNNVVQTQVRGNSSVSGTDVVNAWLGPGTGGNTVAASGGMGGVSAESHDKRGAGVTSGGISPMGVQNTQNNPAKTSGPTKDKTTLNELTGPYTNTADPAMQVIEYVAKDAATTMPKYIPKVADDAAKITKVAKASKVLGTVGTVIDVGTNVVDGIIYASEGNTSEAAESFTKAVGGVAVAWGGAIAAGAAAGAAGGPVGVLVGVAISVTWAWVSSYDWW